MSMNKFLSLLVTVVLLSPSCNQSAKKELSETLDYYLSGLITFEADLKRHFPFEFDTGEIQDMSFILPSTVKGGGCSVAMLRTQPNPTKFKEIAQDVKAEYDLIDISNISNLIVLPDSSDHSSKVAPVIIPNFDKVLDDDEGKVTMDFNENYDLYLIEKKSGNYTGKDDLQDKPYLPEKIEHGFSRGICIDVGNENVIYWLLLW